MVSASELVEQYLSERCVSVLYGKSIRRLAAGVGSLTVQHCNRYLQKRVTQVSSVTVAHERAMLIVLWRYARDRDLVESIPRGIVKVRASRPPTRAWTLEQCCTAVKATFQHDGEQMRCGCSLGLFLRCWLLLGYESGARRGDLWAMRRDHFSGDTLWWTQHKTGDPCPKILSEQCVEAVNAMLDQSPDGTVLSWATCASGASKRMLKFLRALKMRRSSATHIEMANPGKGRLHLGHRTIGLAEKAYIDWTQVRRDIPRAPNLLE
jgi:integrase